MSNWLIFFTHTTLIVVRRSVILNVSVKKKKKNNRRENLRGFFKHDFVVVCVPDGRENRTKRLRMTRQCSIHKKAISIARYEFYQGRIQIRRRFAKLQRCKHLKQTHETY